jgi:hypothetical protein
MINSNITELDIDETCTSSFYRLFMGVDQTYQSVKLDSNGKYEDSSFPADNSSLWWES